MLNDQTANGESLIFGHRRPLFLGVLEDEALEEIGHEDPGVVVVIDQAVWLVDCEAADIQSLVERAEAKVEEDALAHLEACRWEVGVIWPNLDIRECRAKELEIPPEQDLASIKIDQRADDITNCPSLAVVLMIDIPFLDSVAVERVGIWAVTDTILTIEARIATTPADLHQTIRQ